MGKKLVASASAAAVVGAAGLLMIKSFEGVRYKPYRDVGGIWTVCYGHTGRDVIPGKTYTREDCTRFLREDTIKHNRYIDQCVRVPLTRYQRDALISFTYNVGGGAFCRSNLVKKLNRRDYFGAAQELPKWNKVRVNGKLVESRGLTRRRLAERDLFLHGE